MIENLESKVNKLKELSNIEKSLNYKGEYEKINLNGIMRLKKKFGIMMKVKNQNK
jgi:hypothetical protein